MAGPASDLLERLAKRLGGKASVRVVFGEPVTCDGVTIIPVLSGTCSMNCTCRQFCASSCPVLSNESAVNVGGSPGSSFHSLHATSHALQPMQIDVSVKKPSGFSCQAT